MLDGLGGIDVEPTIRKRIRRHVEGAHNERAFAQTHLEMADFQIERRTRGHVWLVDSGMVSG